jgi:hypothetical protein
VAAQGAKGGACQSRDRSASLGSGIDMSFFVV